MAEPREIHLVAPLPIREQAGAKERGTLLRRSLVPLLLLLAWSGVTFSGVVSEQLLPSPLSLGRALLELWKDGLGTHLLVSLGRVAGGATIGVSLGLVLGLASGLWRLGEEGIDATMQMIRTIPFLALVPLFIVWFGVGEMPKTLLIAMACLAPMYLNTSAAVRNVDARLVEAMRSYGMNGLRLIARVIVPMAAPGILTDLAVRALEHALLPWRKTQALR